MTKNVNILLRPRPRSRSTLEGRTRPRASFDEALVTYLDGEDAASDDPTKDLPQFPELEPEPTTPDDNFSSVPFSAMIQSVLQQLDLGEGEDGSTVVAAAAETPPLPFQPRKTPVKIVHSSSSGDSKLLPMCEEEGWVLGLPFQPRKTPVKIIHSTKLPPPPMDVEEGWVLPLPSKTRFRPVKRSGSGRTGTGRFSYLKPRKTDFAETVA